MPGKIKRFNTFFVPKQELFVKNSTEQLSYSEGVRKPPFCHLSLITKLETSVSGPRTICITDVSHVWMEGSNECVNVITQNCLNATFHRKVSICKTLYQFCLLIILKFPFRYYFTNWSRDSSLPYQAQWIHMNVEDPGW